MELSNVLQIADAFVLALSGGIFMLQQAFNFNNELYNTLFPIVIYPLAGFSMTGNQQIF